MFLSYPTRRSLSIGFAKKYFSSLKQARSIFLSFQPNHLVKPEQIFCIFIASNAKNSLVHPPLLALASSVETIFYKTAFLFQQRVFPQNQLLAYLFRGWFLQKYAQNPLYRHQASFFSSLFREHFFSPFCLLAAKGSLFSTFQLYSTKFHDIFQQFLPFISAIICL